MVEKNFIPCSTEIFFGFDFENSMPQGDFGAILSRAGVGKTSSIVQLALCAMLNNEKVLHVSLDDPVDKISLWYKEIFNLIAGTNNINDADILLETMLPCRFIMTFKVDSFSVPKLAERLTDLVEHNIFSPQLIIIDGFNFDDSARETLLELKNFVKTRPSKICFTVRTHRHEDPGPGIIPEPISGIADLFDVIVQLRPEGKKIDVVALKKASEDNNHSGLLMDPATMLLTAE